jgi:hypothetical protein
MQMIQQACMVLYWPWNRLLCAFLNLGHWLWRAHHQAANTATCSRHIIQQASSMQRLLCAYDCLFCVLNILVTVCGVPTMQKIRLQSPAPADADLTASFKHAWFVMHVKGFVLRSITLVSGCGVPTMPNTRQPLL